MSFEAPRTSSPLREALDTIRRKLVRSVETRGVGRTVVRAFVRPVGWLLSRPLDAWRRRGERAFDRAHGVNTRRDRDPGWMSRIESPNWRHGIGYEPARTDVVLDALGALPIDPSRFTLVDYGCGKGKVLLLASHLGFERIVGVEYDPRLAAIADENARAYAPSERRSRTIEVRNVDAVDFEVPDAPLVLFFHHPFEAPVLEKVVERVTASLDGRPREAWVVYVDPRDESTLTGAGFRRVGEPVEGCLVLEYEPGSGRA